MKPATVLEIQSLELHDAKVKLDLANETIKRLEYERDRAKELLTSTVAQCDSHLETKRLLEGEIIDLRQQTGNLRRLAHYWRSRCALGFEALRLP